MVRRYEPKRPHPGDPSMRRARAAELRGQGLSLRETAARLKVSHQTIANDLARWDHEQATVTPIPLSNPAVKSRPVSGRKLTAEVDSGPATVIPLRRSS